jgi:hypothetical protein
MRSRPQDKCGRQAVHGRPREWTSSGAQRAASDSLLQQLTPRVGQLRAFGQSVNRRIADGKRKQYGIHYQPPRDQSAKPMMRLPSANPQTLRAGGALIVGHYPGAGAGFPARYSCPCPRQQVSTLAGCRRSPKATRKKIGLDNRPQIVYVCILTPSFPKRKGSSSALFGNLT